MIIRRILQMLATPLNILPRAMHRIARRQNNSERQNHSHLKQTLAQTHSLLRLEQLKRKSTNAPEQKLCRDSDYPASRFPIENPAPVKSTVKYRDVLPPLLANSSPTTPFQIFP
jgi:hypothetical protein